MTATTRTRSTATPRLLIRLTGSALLVTACADPAPAGKAPEQTTGIEGTYRAAVTAKELVRAGVSAP